MRKRTIGRLLLTAAALGGAFAVRAAGPTDNLRADYRNAVHGAPWTNGAEQVAVQLGAGSG